MTIGNDKPDQWQRFIEKAREWGYDESETLRCRVPKDRAAEARGRHG